MCARRLSVLPQPSDIDIDFRARLDFGIESVLVLAGSQIVASQGILEDLEMKKEKKESANSGRTFLKNNIRNVMYRTLSLDIDASQ